MTFAKGSEMWAFMCSWFPDKQCLICPNNVSEEVPLILVLDDKNLVKTCSESRMSVLSKDVTFMSSLNLHLSCISTDKLHFNR